MSKPSIICIIDDDSIYRFTIVRTLEIEKVAETIITFADGEEAIQFIQENLGDQSKLPDVIFLDINMPIMDGWQFLEEYEKIFDTLGKTIIIYLVTSSIDPADMDRAKKISLITRYLTKPLKPESLRSLVGADEE